MWVVEIIAFSREDKGEGGDGKEAVKGGEELME